MKLISWCHFKNFTLNLKLAVGDGEGQGSLVCCSPCCRKESDTTKQLNNDKLKAIQGTMAGYEVG